MNYTRGSINEINCRGAEELIYSLGEHEQRAKNRLKLSSDLPVMLDQINFRVLLVDLKLLHFVKIFVN